MWSKNACLRLLGLFTFLVTIHGLIHDLEIHNDDRHIFKIETFGFNVGGQISLNFHEFRLHYPWSYPMKNSNNATKNNGQSKEDLVEEIAGSGGIRHHQRRLAAAAVTSAKKNSTHFSDDVSQAYYKAGFIMRQVTSESMAQQELEAIIERGICIFDKLQPTDLIIDMTSPGNWKSLHFGQEIDSITKVGFYSLIFAHCGPMNTVSLPDGTHRPTPAEIARAKPLLVSFHLHAEFYNPGPNYLSAGEAPLPSLYLVFFFLFAVASFVWVYVLRSASSTGNSSSSGSNVKSEPKNVHRIHYMMLILIIFKCFTLLFESIRYHYIAKYGVSETWNIVYFVFATLKGVMLFTVILLIGSGYSLMKNYLNDQEKRIISVVLILQVLDNVAMVILEETAPGSQMYSTWRDILHLVDIMCCLAILIPIVWSIQHLRQAAEADGKAHNNLLKLTLFRQFYVMVVIYVYFTRIAVYLLSATVPFYLLWLGPLAEESATLIFYVVTGYKFQPAVDNPYLPVSSEDLEGAEYGLDDASDHVDIELVGSLRSKKATNSSSN